MSLFDLAIWLSLSSYSSVSRCASEHEAAALGEFRDVARPILEHLDLKSRVGGERLLERKMHGKQLQRHGGEHAAVHGE